MAKSLILHTNLDQTTQHVLKSIGTLKKGTMLSLPRVIIIHIPKAQAIQLGLLQKQRVQLSLSLNQEAQTNGLKQQFR